MFTLCLDWLGSPQIEISPRAVAGAGSRRGDLIPTLKLDTTTSGGDNKLYTTDNWEADLSLAFFGPETKWKPVKLQTTAYYQGGVLIEFQDSSNEISWIRVQVVQEVP